MKILYHLALFFSLSSAARAYIVIDDFSVGGTSLSGTSGASGFISSTQGPLSSSDILGGYRQIRFEVPPTPTGTVSMNVDTTDHRFNYSVTVPGGAGTLSAINLRMLYNGSSTDTSAMNLDLTGGGADGMGLNFDSANFNGGFGYFDIFMYSSNGQGFYDYQQVFNSASPFTVDIPFHWPGSAFDPTHVTSINIGTANGGLKGPGGFVLDSITTTTVPEPLGLGAALTILACLIRPSRAQAGKPIMGNERSIF